jgi:hypothetical protein
VRAKNIIPYSEFGSEFHEIRANIVKYSADSVVFMLKFVLKKHEFRLFCCGFPVIQDGIRVPDLRNSLMCRWRSRPHLSRAANNWLAISRTGLTRLSISLLTMIPFVPPQTSVGGESLKLLWALPLLKLMDRCPWTTCPRKPCRLFKKVKLVLMK